ncbi:hypothetical protein HFN20_26160 [Paenibacillus dendritiformis]|uniref:hypothetical protein n=1 Tax=Paenibacillus dendritiformis TaxID=130049 RepID=UPI00143DB017|nr:hypothetical protein [Paenibacillus dendritiformis]NKI24639.1 hypothetical protein [Paenibacillus dendritiformis]NRF98353.1 hypothetical protein [Paenibacillus dendritiformis]
MPLTRWDTGAKRSGRTSLTGWEIEQSASEGARLTRWETEVKRSGKDEPDQMGYRSKEEREGRP